jgi:hypothetical protein
VLCPGGRTAFFTIHPAAGLTGAQRRRASRDGPPGVANARPYRALLAAAGFTQVTQTDYTAEFAAVARAWVDQWDANFSGVVALLGEHTVRERQAERRAQLRAIGDGILARSLFTAIRPEENHRRQRQARRW